MIYDLVEQDAQVDEYFHATQDKQLVRDHVLGVIQKYLDGVVIDSRIVEKAKTGAHN